MKKIFFSVARRIVSSVGNVASSLGRFAGKLWLLPPCQKIDRAFHKAWKGNRPIEYRFLPYVASVLRVLGWAVLVIGVVASVFFGLQIINDGLAVAGTELIGVDMGVCAIILGVVGSFLAWLFLLVNRELLYLFIHVKENTRNTAGRVTEQSN